MSRQPFIELVKSRLTRLRAAVSLADSAFWAAGLYGMISAGFLLGALEPAERDRLDDLAANAQNIREAELRAQGVFA